MMFQAEAMTTNMAMMVAIRNHSLSASRGRPALCAASSEVRGATSA